VQGYALLFGFPLSKGSSTSVDEPFEDREISELLSRIPSAKMANGGTLACSSPRQQENQEQLDAHAQCEFDPGTRPFCFGAG
jgi:hypothetical protein